MISIGTLDEEARMRTRVLAGIELAVLAAATLWTYRALWTAQRALWTNGLVEGMDPFAYPRADADPVAGGDQAVVVVRLGLLACVLFLWIVLRARRFEAAGLRWVAFAIPVVVAVGLFLLPPSLSIDAYSYLSHGYLAATPGSNPYLDASSSVADTPYGPRLIAEGWQAVHPQSPYGPVWTAVERLAVTIAGPDVPLGILLIKLPVLLALLGTAVLIGVAVPRERRTRAVLLLLANPLVLVELAGDGHNDGVMAGFLVLSIVCATRGRTALSIVALALAVLIKLNALPFALPIAVALIVLRRSTRRLLVEGAIGVAISAVVGIAAILPYWAGPLTFQGLQASGSTWPGWSLPGLLSTWLDAQRNEFGALPDAGPPLAQLVCLGLLVLGTALAAVSARSAPGLIRACGIVSLLVLLLLPLEWPWYGTLPAAILPLGAGAVDVLVVLLVAVGSRIVAPIGDASTVGAVSPELFSTWQPLIGQTIPAALGLVLVSLRRGRRAAREPRTTVSRSG